MKNNPLAQINGRKTLERIGIFGDAQARSAAIVYKDAAKKAAIARPSDALCRMNTEQLQMN